MNKIKANIVLFLILIGPIVSFAQSDSLAYIENDTIFTEERPNYIGVNISPLVASIAGGYDKNIKMSIVYKRNFGDKNLRASLNYSTIANHSQYNTYKVINTTDSTYDARFFSNTYKSYDIRLGVEELRGYRFARLHIGADLILGTSEQNHSYFSRTLAQDSSTNYSLAKDIESFDNGFTKSKYFNVGVDVSFGFDWFLSDEFLFTFQFTPQFNYFILTSSQDHDSYNELRKPSNFADFKLGYFDAYLVFKF